MADGYLIRLYDNAGQQIGEAETDVDLMAAENRDLVIDSTGSSGTTVAGVNPFSSDAE